MAIEKQLKLQAGIITRLSNFRNNPNNSIALNELIDNVINYTVNLTQNNARPNYYSHRLNLIDSICAEIQNAQDACSEKDLHSYLYAQSLNQDEDIFVTGGQTSKLLSYLSSAADKMNTQTKQNDPIIVHIKRLSVKQTDSPLVQEAINLLKTYVNGDFKKLEDSHHIIDERLGKLREIVKKVYDSRNNSNDIILYNALKSIAHYETEQIRTGWRFLPVSIPGSQLKRAIDAIDNKLNNADILLQENENSVINRLRQKLANKNTEITRLENDNISMQVTIKELKKQNNEKNEETETFKKATIDLVEKVQEYAYHIRERDKFIDEIPKETKDIIEESVRLKDENVNLKKENEVYKKTNTILHKENDALKARINSLNETIKTQTDLAETFKNLSKNYEEELQNCYSEIEELKAKTETPTNIANVCSSETSINTSQVTQKSPQNRKNTTVIFSNSNKNPYSSENSKSTFYGAQKSPRHPENLSGVHSNRNSSYSEMPKKGVVA